MRIPEVDRRTQERRLRDEQIAAEAQMDPPELAAEAVPLPMESRLDQHRRRPLAVVGIVENGLVRPLDDAIKLPEHSRVIIVAPDGS